MSPLPRIKKISGIAQVSSCLICLLEPRSEAIDVLNNIHLAWVVFFQLYRLHLGSNFWGNWLRKFINMVSSRHIKTHIRPYRCSNCGDRFSEQRDLDRHHDKHGKIRLYFCPVVHCPWHVRGDKHGFSRRLDNAKRHLKLHKGLQNLSVLREDSQGRLSRV